MKNLIEIKQPIKVIDSENYYLIIEDADKTRHYFHKKHENKYGKFKQGEYDGCSIGVKNKKQADAIFDNMKDDDFKLDLLEAVWLMRWNKEKTGMAAVLTEEEANEICDNILIVLKKQKEGKPILRNKTDMTLQEQFEHEHNRELPKSEDYRKEHTTLFKNDVIRYWQDYTYWLQSKVKNNDTLPIVSPSVSLEGRELLIAFSEFINKTFHLSYLPKYIDKFLKRY